ncbi:MAG: hypothetical protein AABY66_01880, partial [Nitrospirota bacterium]
MAFCFCAAKDSWYTFCEQSLNEEERMEFTLTDYINHALECAEYDKLEDGSFAGRIPKCKGVVAFAKSLRKC